MRADPRSLVETLRHGVPAARDELAATAAPAAPVVVSRVEIDAAEPAADAAPRDSGPQPTTMSTWARTTVLPRRKVQPLASAAPERPRFDHLRILGEGGMGQVELARDNDIRRTVAVKRLKGDVRSAEALLRFADEVRIVGQLEHPAIVPIYDVGKDADGEVYLVMKHLQGETMETIIEHLRSGDPAYVQRFPPAQRVHIFLAVLDAMRYAHARGIIHRDLKPANLMIGPYGEVTVLDWGIAKPIGQPKPGATEALALDNTLLGSQDGRLHDTAIGALAGTPMYMSPEQAAGHNEELDERSDVYTLSVILLEWLTLEHPRKDKRSLFDLLGSIAHEDIPKDYFDRAVARGVRVPYLQLAAKGLVRNRDERYQSVAELERAIQNVVDGRMPIQCHVTLAQRVAHEGLRWIDNHVVAYTLTFFGAIAVAAIALVWGVYRLIFGS
jgi:eukaryotic-like serine/threonine-protein kinase